MKKLSQIINSSKVFALLEDSKSIEEESRNLLFTDPVEDIVAHTENELPRALAKIEEYRQQGKYLCGYVAYEAGYFFIDKKISRNKDNHQDQALLHFVAFDSMQALDRKTIDNAFLDIKQDALSQLCAHGFKLNVSKESYLHAISRIKEYIAAGDTYQINYTLKLKFKLRGSAIALYQALRRTQPVEYGAFLNFSNLKIISLSPELFVKKEEATLIAKPMKGTAKRGIDKVEDESIVHSLKKDPKTLSENVMIVDLIRNDFGRICKTGSVIVKNLFEVQTFKTVHQMISTVRGKLKSDISFERLLYGLFPCGSITGAPKIRTMEIINELESEARGVYTGAIGYILPNNDFHFNVPIRTIIMNKPNQCEMGIGSGIIHESDANAEFEECKLKSDFLTNLNDNFYLIETFKFDARKKAYESLEKHILRLKTSAEYFGFKLDLDAIDARLAEIKKELFSENEHYKIRLCLYQDAHITLSYEKINEKSILDKKKVMIGKQKINTWSIFQYHKTSRREVYNEEFDKATQLGYYDAIILNERDEIAEACRHNVFIRKNGQLLTPPLASGILHGVYRSKMIDRENVIEQVISLSDLKESDEILLTNSVRGMVKVELG